MRTYDDWKTTPPPLWDEAERDPDCTCTGRKRDKWCPVHGIDPDTARDEMLERRR